MAATEAIQFEQTGEVDELNPSPYLYLVEGSVDQPEHIAGQPPVLVDVDTIPELGFVRRRGAHEAAAILARNRQLLRDGDFDNVPLPVDPLGTAKRVVEMRRTNGLDSDEYKESFEGLLLDSERLIGEAFRKNTWEYFGKTFQSLDPTTRLYMAHGRPVLDITESGLSPIAEPEEVDRRTNDHIAELAHHAIPQVRAMGHTALQGAVRFRGISECADWAIVAYKTDKKGSHGGYAPAVEKLMIGDLVFNESDDREQEQMALPGLFITHKVITTVLEQTRAIPEGQSLTKTELHGMQFIDKSKKGLMGFVELLDQEASRVSRKNIFRGEEVSDDYEKNYDDIEEQAEQRRLKLAPKPLELTEYLIHLEENNTDRWVVEALVDKFLKRMLLEVAAKNPSQAADIFDQQTADGLVEVARLQAIGLDDQARNLRLTVEMNAPDVSFCGAGSCGLEALRKGSKEDQEASELGLTGEKLKDKDRKCPECRKKSIVYDEKGSKGCLSCGNKEIKK